MSMPFTPVTKWGYEHNGVSWSRRALEERDGFVYVNTMEDNGAPWFDPIEASQDKLPLVLGLFEFVHNAKRRQSFAECC